MDKSKKRILALSGSIRIGSTNHSLLRYIGEVYSDEIALDFYDGMDSLPHFSPDLDTENVSGPVREFREMISASDGVIICTPEYIFSLPATLKNAIEWTVSTTVFLDKPVALIVASGLGEKTFESLTLIMTTVGAKIGERAALLIQGTRGKFNEHGELADEKTKIAVQQTIRSFIETIPTPS